MPSNNQSEPVFLIKRLLKESTIDTKKLHEGAAELTKQKIINAAVQRFAARGYQKTSIDEIAKEAGVTKGAVYHHFKDKKELLMVANRSRQLRTQEIMQEAIAETGDFFEGLKNALGGEFRRLRSDPTTKGVMREYLAMAMTDADVSRMYQHDDAELIDILSSELAKSYPKLSSRRRISIVAEIYISLAGVLIASVVDSAIGTPPEQLIDSIIDRFRDTIEKPG
jgi:AcrR family transcriptional regulator